MFPIKTPYPLSNNPIHTSAISITVRMMNRITTSSLFMFA
ncbi:hypothetical protein SB96558_2014 [Shigella boydii 965-58]|nr:hypothetical protein SB96558_2014 [Shigella boydii 965-58]